MPTIDLHDNPVVPDGWHRVMSPGGYEWWRFDAEDRNSDVQIVVSFFEGFVFHPGYARRYQRYLRQPTRVAPPVPAEYPCVHVAVYEEGRLLAQSMTQFEMTEFEASDRQVDVRIGEGNRVERQADHSYRVTTTGQPWAVTWRGPQPLVGGRLDVEPLFRPRAAAATERTFLSRELAGAEHQWIIAAPFCDVGGVIHLNGGAGSATREIVFTGVGYHDHKFGTGPVGPGVRRWIWGRLLLNDRAVTFHFARPSNRTRPDEIHLVEAGPDSSTEISVQHVAGDWNQRTREYLHFPAYLQFDHALLLTNPRVVDTSPFNLRLIYEARWRNQGGEAFCEIAYPHRLRWAVLGRLIEPVNPPAVIFDVLTIAKGVKLTKSHVSREPGAICMMLRKEFAQLLLFGQIRELKRCLARD